jgi:hypothetical protein
MRLGWSSKVEVLIDEFGELSGDDVEDLLVV